MPKSERSVDDVLYNLHIELEQGVKGLNEFKGATLLNSVSPFLGLFRVTDSGRLIRGVESGLHIYEGKIDPFESGHIHFNRGKYMSRVAYKKGCGFLVDGYKVPGSVHTLGDLYNEKCSDESMEDVLARELKKHSDFEFKSISSRGETRVKLLENHYRKKVLD